MFLTSKFAKFSIIFANFDVFSSSFREGGGEGVQSYREEKVESKVHVQRWRENGSIYIVQKRTVKKGGGYGMNLWRENKVEGGVCLEGIWGREEGIYNKEGLYRWRNEIGAPRTLYVDIGDKEGRVGGGGLLVGNRVKGFILKRCGSGTITLSFLHILKHFKEN